MSGEIAVVWRKKIVDLFYFALHCFGVTCYVQADLECVQHH